MVTTVGTSGSGGRQGNGTFTVTPPASAAAYVALIVSSDAGTITPPSGFTLEQDLGMGTLLYKGTSSAGSTWTTSGFSGTALIAGVVAGFDENVALGTVSTASSLVSPSITATVAGLAMRFVVGATSANSAVGYPAGATLGRATRTQWDGTSFGMFSAIAFSAQSAGSTGTATFTKTSVLGSTAATVMLTPIPATPTGLTLTPGADSIGFSFNAVTGADSYILEYRQTGLTAPSLTTQTSAAKHLYRMFNASIGGGTSYGHTWNGSGVRHYCVDSGVRTTHNEFTGRVATGFSLGATPATTDTINHGTGAASLLGGTTYGVAKGVTLVSVQCIDAATGPGDPLLAAELEDVVDFILSDKGTSPAVVTITMSLDGMQEGGTNSPGVVAQLQRLVDARVPYVIASANLNDDITTKVAEAPAETVWAGSSFPDTDARTPGSNYGPANLLFAPVGEEGYSSNVTTGASNASNSASREYGATSGATPAIGGVMAKNKQANPALGVARIQEVLFSQARRGIITSVPTGPNHMVNANAIITDWTQHPVAGTSGSLDELGILTDWEFRVRTVDGGVISEPSASESATTDAGAPPAGGFAGSYGWGAAVASGARNSDGGFVGGYAWGAAVAGGQRDSDGGFAGAYGWGPAVFGGSGPSGGGFAGSYGWGDAVAAGEADYAGGFAGAYGWGPAVAGGPAILPEGVTMSNQDLEKAYLAAQGATGPSLSDSRDQVYVPTEWEYFSALSGLTPASKFSLSDHKLAYYKAQSGSSGSIADTSRSFWG